jgi:hypothetical protein
MEPTAGACGWCGRLLEGRVDKRYCSASHRRQARRRRKRDREGSNSLSHPGQSSAAGEAARAADERFRAILAADQAERAPQAQASEWAAYARRHGTVHPGEQAARIARGHQARAQDWQQGTERFIRPGSSIGEAGRRARSQQLMPMSSYESAGPSQWDDEDLKAEMIDIGNFRRGRKF